MQRLLTLQRAAVLAVAGIAGGIYIGNAAIDSVNPFYYSPMPQRSFAALTPYRGATGTTYAAAPVSAEESRVALGTGCIGCRTYPEEYRPDSSLERQLPDDAPASLGSEYGYRLAAAEAPAPDAEHAAVARYASYKVSDDERADQADRFADADALRAQEDQAVSRGTDQLIY